MRYLFLACMLTWTAAAEQARYYTTEVLPTPEDVPFEVSGLATLPDGRLAISIRMGEVWLLENPEGPVETARYTRIASALHEPLGLAWHDGGLYTTQRGELTRLEDRNGDGVIDAYRTVSSAWGVSGNYHEYVFGPVVDAKGNFWITLNQTIGETVKPQQAWRGWGARIAPDGAFHPVAPGMRSPCGLGLNLAGDVFFTDQQGNWVPAGTLHHLRPGVFYGHIESLRDVEREGSTLDARPQIAGGKPYPEALQIAESLVPPAVWFPYRKMGMSATDILADSTEGGFGPFAGQLFVGDFTMAQVNRVFLEKVDGEYQGGCVRFLEGFQSAVLRLAWGRDDTLFVGQTNRGWNSVGTAPFGLERVRWTGKTPFEILSVHAEPDGFRLSFTQPVDPATAGQTDAYELSSYTYYYQVRYGSEEIDSQAVAVAEAHVSPDKRSVHLVCENLRPGYVHEIHAEGLRSKSGQRLLHTVAYYTLNALPTHDVHETDKDVLPADGGPKS